MTPLWLRDLSAFAIQLTLIIGAGGVLAWALQLTAPRIALRYWQLLLFGCLLLPFCQPWQETFPPPSAPAVLASATLDASPVVTRDAAEPATPRSASSWLAIALAAGIVARLLWLALGAARLHWLRRRATPLTPLPAPFVAAQERTAVAASICVCENVSGPITFGFRDPIVIVPPAVLDMPAHVQEAIAVHELLHVQRRDWLYEVAEEGVRTLLWFHPAIWWLIERIQLAREQVVDQITIRLTDSRERYVDALLLVALAKSPIALVPAPLFLRKRLLKQRVAQILQETTMTTRRLIASLSASAAALTVAAGVAIQFFPLKAEGQPSSNEPVQILKGGEHLLHGSLPEYPRRAIEQKVQGDVVLDLSLDDRGEVSDARVLSGPDELRRVALESVLQWHYSPASLQSTSVQATLRFRMPTGEASFEGRKFALAEKIEIEGGELTAARKAEHVMKEVSEKLQDPTVTGAERDEFKSRYAEARIILEKLRADREKGVAQEWTGPLKLAQISSERLTETTRQEVIARAGIHVGDAFTDELVKRVFEAAGAVDEHINVRIRNNGRGGMVITLINP